MIYQERAFREPGAPKKVLRYITAVLIMGIQGCGTSHSSVMRASERSQKLPITQQQFIKGNQKFQVAHGRVAAVPIKTYNCHDAAARTGNHCYAVAIWDSARQLGFFSANVSLVNLKAQANQFLDNELWLIDKSCNSGCWIEAGFMSDRTSNFSGPVYFWAVGRPNGRVDVTYFGPVSNAQYGKFARIVLKGAGKIWRANITPPGAKASFTSGNVALSMKPTNVDLGQELSGNHGAYAPRARFEHISAGVVSPSALPGAGHLGIDKPPYGGWLVAPSKAKDFVFFTQCC